MDRPADTAPLSARQVARIVGIAEGRLAYWARTGLCAPSLRAGSRRLYSFADLVEVKAAFDLTERGVSLQSVRSNLRALRAALPRDAVDAARPGPDRLLGRLRVVSDGQTLVVLGDAAVFEPLSGQVVMDFLVESLSARAAEVLSLPSRQALPDDEGGAAYDHLARAVRLLEQGQAAEADAALARALALDATLAAAHNNRGVIALRDGRAGEAIEHFTRALAADPGQPEAQNNLALAYAERGDRDFAQRTWRTVCATSPGFADAHFNLGAALAADGSSDIERAAGRYHLLRYLELDGDSPFAEAARRLLDGARGTARSPTA